MDKQEKKNVNDNDVKELKKTVIGKYSFIFLLLGLCFFLPAGTVLYWEAWLYISSIMLPILLVLRYLFKNDLEVLRRRMETGEQRKPQRLIKMFANSMILGIFLIPGFDRRYDWSSVPTWLVITADLVFIGGYYLFFLVLKENSFASRIVKVEKDIQKVITTGPYSKVRHPMYSAIFVMFGFTPLALGSYWALLSAFAMMLVVVFRIRDEEEMLIKELDGYAEYMKKTKYRIIPGIW